MNRLRDALIDLIEPDFGLLDALLANGLLCNRKYAEVRSLLTVYKRNERLLKFVLANKTEDRSERFIEALKLTQQIHVVNFIQNDGIKSEDSADSLWPLSSKERHILNKNRFHLVNSIDPDNGLINGLLSRFVISQRQMEFILSCPPGSEKVEALLEILLRRSNRDLNATVKCLKEVNQDHISKLLYRDGAILPIHIKNTEEIESEVLPALRGIISGGRGSPNERMKMVELLRLSDEDIYIISFERTASIVMRSYCLSCKSLEHLYALWESGRLAKYVETTFRQMTSREVELNLELELNVGEYERLREQLGKNEIDAERQIGVGSIESNALLEEGGEEYHGYEGTEALTSSERTEKDFLRVFLEVDEKVSECEDELQQTFDAQFLSLKEEVSSMRKNFLELVRSRSVVLPYPSEEKEDFGGGVLRATAVGRSLSAGCANRLEMEDDRFDRARSSTRNAISRNDTQQKLNSRRYQQSVETEELPTVCTCVKLKDLDIKDRISFGIAYFMESFYAICLESNTILTYKSSSPFDLEDQLTITGLKAPHDIAASHLSLYITDSSSNQIYKMDANHKSWCWMEGVGEPHTISVTPNQEVLLVSSGKPSEVKFFAPDATLRRSISLPGRITRPTHAVGMTDGRVILSHGGIGSCEQEICEFSTDGTVLRAFPSDCIPSEKLSRPCHLAVDPVKGLVFVADFWNKRILVLNARFEPLAEIPRELDSPWRLCYSPQLRQLLVGAGHTVEVYDVTAKA